MATETRGEVLGGLLVVEAGRVGRRSPRMHTSAQMTVRPPRMMCCVPCSWERRETLLPVSVVTKVGLGGFWAVVEVVEGGMVVWRDEEVGLGFREGYVRGVGSWGRGKGDMTGGKMGGRMRVKSRVGDGRRGDRERLISLYGG